MSEFKIQQDIESIRDQVRKNSGSYGYSPYTITDFRVDDLKQLKTRLPVIHTLLDFTHMIGILVFDDYDQNSLLDHALYSSEFLEMDETYRNRYLNEIEDLLIDPEQFSTWVEQQANLALGIIYVSCRQKKYKTKIITDQLIELIAPFIRKLPNQKLVQLIAIRKETDYTL